MNNTITRVKCGNCHQYHNSASEVRACYFPPQPSIAPAAVASFSQPVAQSDPITQRQLDYIAKLGGDVSAAAKLTKYGASIHIKRLLREGNRPAAQSVAPEPPKPSISASAPNRRETKIPLSMLHEVPDGYFATRQDATRPWTFFKVSRPKSGNFKGCLKVMTQHGPDYRLALVVYPGDRLYWHNMAVEDDLLLVCVDKNGCAISYAEQIGRCMRCNTELTDERSRWYGIGPECEKRWPQIIGLVEDRKGTYRPGWEA